MSYAEPTLPPGKIVRISSNDVLIGMYISELDCKWSDTPFPLGGFHVKNTDDIQLLQKLCKRVVVDINKGASPARHRGSNVTILSTARQATPAAANLRVNRAAYPVSKTMKQTLDRSAHAYHGLCDLMVEQAQAVREGEALDLVSLEPLSKKILDSVISNPQALIWVLCTEDIASSHNSYCVRAAIWAAVLARQFGLTQNDMSTLFLGTLLCDIGMQLLPERLTLKKGPFSKKEYRAYCKHVEFSLELIPAYEQVNEKVLRIVRAHHERHDGRGFPKGLKGDQIPALARFASLAYSFERLLCSVDRSKRVSPAKALSKLYRQRNLKFPEQLVVEFIHLLGTYPLGSLLRLSTGELGLVVEQNPEARLCPRVAIIGAGKQLLAGKPKVVDLSAQKNGKQSRSILGSVHPSELNINLEDYRFRFVGKKVRLPGFSFRL